MTELHEWKKVRSELTPELRRRVIWRDQGRCTVCATRDNPHIDHIVPVSLGGQSTIFNLWVLCAKHNTQKGAQWPTFWALDVARSAGHNGISLGTRWQWRNVEGDPIDTNGDDLRKPLVLAWIDIAIEECGIEPPDHAKTSCIEHLFPHYRTVYSDSDGR